MTSRIDYDRVADVYDGQPYRAKDVDPDLLEFLAGRGGDLVRVFDAACGTGNQLVADLPHAGAARLVGLDRSTGMLRVARRKSTAIGWVQGDLARLPLAGGSFDFVTCQFAFHHVRDQETAIGEVHRVLAPGGRVVLSNICPEEMEGSLLYRFFPEARERDRADFPVVARVLEWLERAGFESANARFDRRRFERTMAEFEACARRRTDSSQLTAISDGEYLDGLGRIERSSQVEALEDEVCLVRIVANRPG